MKNSNQLTTFLAIIIAGALIAGAIIYSSDESQKKGDAENENLKAAVSDSEKDELEDKKIVAGTPQDAHILGNPNAPIRIIEYSDIECPYCQRFHKTMHQIMDKYGPSGQVAWEYRHFPLEMLHPTAPKEAEATECATELGGNEKFWEYLDYLNENSIAKTNIESELVKVAVKLNLDETAFKTCLESGKYETTIQKSMEGAVEIFNSIKTKYNLQGLGTPFNIVTDKDGNIVTVIPGAYPYENVEQAILQALN